MVPDRISKPLDDQRDGEHMTDRKKIIIISIILTLLAIVCVDIGFGYYMKTAKVVDAGYPYSEYRVTGGTHNEDWGLGEPVSVLDTEEVTHVKRGEESERRTLENGPILTILIVTDIALILAGVFACLICLNFRKWDIRDRVKMFGLYAIYIGVAVFVVLSVYCQFANKTYTP